MMTVPGENFLEEKIFQDEAVGPYLHKEGWDYMKENGIFVHTSKNSVPFKNFPAVAVRCHVGTNKVTALAPRPDWDTILIPFHPSALDEEYFNGRSISEILSPLIRGKTKNKKFISSIQSGYFFFAEMQFFNHEVIHNIGLTSGNVGFMLFDETFSYCYGFDFDFEYSFFSSKNLVEDDRILNGSFSEWDAYFVEHFVKSAPKDTLHIELFETVLRPSISRTFNV